MARNRIEPDDRRQIQIRVPPTIFDALQIAANERGVSVNLLINRAIEDFLDRLIPIEEINLTRD